MVKKFKKSARKELDVKMTEVLAAGWCCFSDVQTRHVWAETPSGFRFRLN